MLSFADFLFFWLHIIIIFFNLFGWAFPFFRKWHLLLVAITLFSWLVMGFWYGFGYCFLTDWHWQIKYKLGETGLPASFVKYFLDRYTPFRPSTGAVDWLTGISYVLAILNSVYLNFFKGQVSKTRSRN
jgi:hypothetical protein